MSFGTDMQQVANELLTEFGEAVTATYVDAGNYDPTTSNVVDNATHTYTGVGHPSPYTAAQIATGVVRVNDVQLLFYSATGVPEIGHIMQVRGKLYNVLTVDQLAVQGLTAAYRLQLRI